MGTDGCLFSSGMTRVFKTFVKSRGSGFCHKITDMGLLHMIWICELGHCKISENSV
jgi:hypothetical protein